jgi:hypothetical protein
MAKFALDELHAKWAIVMTDVKQDYSVGLMRFANISLGTGAER